MSWLVAGGWSPGTFIGTRARFRLADAALARGDAIQIPSVIDPDTAGPRVFGLRQHDPVAAVTHRLHLVAAVRVPGPERPDAPSFGVNLVLSRSGQVVDQVSVFSDPELDALVLMTRTDAADQRIATVSGQPVPAGGSPSSAATGPWEFSHGFSSWRIGDRAATSRRIDITIDPTRVCVRVGDVTVLTRDGMRDGELSASILVAAQASFGEGEVVIDGIVLESTPLP